MNKKAIVFDADDTLWDEQEMLQGFESAVEEIIDRETGEKSDFKRKFTELENLNIPHIGYGFPSYMFSVAEAITANPDWYKHKEKLLDRIKGVISQFTLQGPKLIEGVPQTLSELQNQGFDLYVLTRGVEFEQNFKLEKSGIKGFFKEVAIVSRKNKETYLSTAVRFHLLASNICMVGNSVKADVNPAVEAGWRGIHVPAPTIWAHDEAVIADSDRAHTVNTISDVPNLVINPSFWR